jgi:hypothetical protein
MRYPLTGGSMTTDLIIILVSVVIMAVFVIREGRP